MGGDHGPQVLVDGAKLGLEINPTITELYLIGNETEIQKALKQAQCNDPRLRILHATQVLTMQDDPRSAVRKKKDCSMARAIELVRQGQTEAVISPGNTGGLVATASYKLGRLDAVERPALATLIPTAESQFVFLDGGATPECKPIHLLHFAVMGHIYARELLGKKQPRVGILSNGAEEMKGNELTRQALRLCKEVDLNFLGYVEGHDLFEDHVDVVVTDGFVGNIVLKSVESMGKGFTRLLKKALNANALRKLGAGLAKGAFRSIKHKMDPEEHGGAPLLGLNGNVIKVHGSARQHQVKNAMAQVSAALQHKITDHIQREVAAANQRVAHLLEGAATPA